MWRPLGDAQKLGGCDLPRASDASAGEEALTQLVPEYLVPNKDQMEKLAETAAVSYQDSTIILTVSDFVQKGNKMTITADAATKNRLSAEVSTMSGENPVTINAAYKVLESGLNYMSHCVVSSPKENIELTIDTLNYEPAQ